LKPHELNPSFPVRRPKPQPKLTRLPRLRDATSHDRGDAAAHEHKKPAKPVARVTRGRNFRLRNVHHD
jgi:hypothetical protein